MEALSSSEKIINAILRHENSETYRLLEGPEPHAITIGGVERKYTATDLMSATDRKDPIDVIRKFIGLQVINSGGVDILSDVETCTSLWEKSLEYLKEKLLVRIPRGFQETVRGTQDIRHIWNQAAGNKNSGIRGLYCAGLKVARAMHELRPELLQDYADQTACIEDIFFQDRMDLGVSKMRDGRLNSSSNPTTLG
jgi:hypothetical protein